MNLGDMAELNVSTSRTDSLLSNTIMNAMPTVQFVTWTTAPCLGAAFVWSQHILTKGLLILHQFFTAFFCQLPVILCVDPSKIHPMVCVKQSTSSRTPSWPSSCRCAGSSSRILLAGFEGHVQESR
jgi:hypothetical protein